MIKKIISKIINKIIKIKIIEIKIPFTYNKVN